MRKHLTEYAQEGVLPMRVQWYFHAAYDEDAVRKSAPTSGGVYRLWVKLKDSDKWRILYVGKAVNLEKRLLEHLSDNEENPCLKENLHKYVCGFEYATVDRENDRAGIEKFIYDHYKKPECNRIDPGGTSVEANLD